MKLKYLGKEKVDNTAFGIVEPCEVVSVKPEQEKIAEAMARTIPDRWEIIKEKSERKSGIVEKDKFERENKFKA